MGYNLVPHGHNYWQQHTVKINVAELGLIRIHTNILLCNCCVLFGRRKALFGTTGLLAFCSWCRRSLPSGICVWWLVPLAWCPESLLWSYFEKRTCMFSVMFRQKKKTWFRCGDAQFQRGFWTFCVWLYRQPWPPLPGSISLCKVHHITSSIHIF